MPMTSRFSRLVSFDSEVQHPPASGVHMRKTATYQQLQPENRMTLASMRQQGLGAQAMPRALRRSPVAIARALARNTLPALQEGCHRALMACMCRRVVARPAGKLGPTAWADSRQGQHPAAAARGEQQRDARSLDWQQDVQARRSGCANPRQGLLLRSVQPMPKFTSTRHFSPLTRVLCVGLEIAKLNSCALLLRVGSRPRPVSTTTSTNSNRSHHGQ